MAASKGTMTLTDIMKPVLSILSHVIPKTSLIRAEDASNCEMMSGYRFVYARRAENLAIACIYCASLCKMRHRAAILMNDHLTTTYMYSEYLFPRDEQIEKG